MANQHYVPYPVPVCDVNPVNYGLPAGTVIPTAMELNLKTFKENTGTNMKQAICQKAGMSIPDFEFYLSQQDAGAFQDGQREGKCTPHLLSHCSHRHMQSHNHLSYIKIKQAATLSIMPKMGTHIIMP